MGAASGSSRSDRTKAAILAAARQRFAEDGYERATIRAIAADAEIDPSMVMRYFGNKELLFAAAVDFDLGLPQLRGLPVEEWGATLAAHVADLQDGDEATLALLRAGVTNEVVAARARAIFTTQLGELVGSVCDDEELAARRAGLVGSQLIGLLLIRDVLKVPSVVAMDRHDVVSWLGPTLQRYLVGEVEPAG